eukprot:scaffold19291_cov79-Skeletonema_dohrnii-CCMP3373.AAC.2
MPEMCKPLNTEFRRCFSFNLPQKIFHHDATKRPLQHGRRLLTQDRAAIMRLISVLLAAVVAFHPISALTTPSSPPSLILMPAALTTKGGAAAAARNVKLAASPSSSAATYNSGDRPMSEALLSIRKCYRTCFFASAVDVTITLIDDKIWSKLFGPKSLLHLRWIDYVDIFDS